MPDMGSLGGYIAAVCVGVAVAYFSSFLVPKIKILYWVSHNFLHTIPVNQQQGAPLGQQLAIPQAAPQTFRILTHSVTVQNFGRWAADWVEIVHRKRPDLFQFYPSLNYRESTTPAGEHVLRVNSVAPKEWFTIQFLSSLNMPELLFIRSAAGHATLIPWMPVRRYPQWVYRGMWGLMLIGSGFCVYWVIRAVVFLLKLAHVL